MRSILPRAGHNLIDQLTSVSTYLKEGCLNNKIQVLNLERLNHRLKIKHKLDMLRVTKMISVESIIIVNSNYLAILRKRTTTTARWGVNQTQGLNLWTKAIWLDLSTLILTKTKRKNLYLLKESTLSNLIKSFNSMPLMSEKENWTIPRED